MHLRPRVQSSKMSDTAEMVGQSGHESQQVKFVSDYQSSFNAPSTILHPTYTQELMNRHREKLLLHPTSELNLQY